ncbi:MAG: vitamin K epoxide reductase family protein [Chloroflexaceae bacterium]
MERSLYPRMAVTLFALLGIIDAAYLTLTRFFPSVGLTCPLAGGGCETVQMSPWSTFPPGGGAPIAVLGIIGYLVLFGLGLAALQTERVGRVDLPVALLVAASGGIATAIYLVSIQLFVITAVCSWCVISALLMVGIWIAAFIDWRSWRGGLTGPGRLAGTGVAQRAR